MKAVLLVLATCLLAACAVPIARFTAIALDGPPVAGTRPATPDRVTGRSCRWWVIGFQFGIPQIDEALADALRGTGTTELRDAELLSLHPYYGLAGRHCYAITGTPAAVDPDATGAPSDDGKRFGVWSSSAPTSSKPLWLAAPGTGT